MENKNMKMSAGGALLLSFIVPVYNVEQYLEECLDSLLNQDVPHEEYEIICINDGSTDSSSAILEDYANKNPNIRVIHQENGGVSAARNMGLDIAKGEYIWFVDSDDIITHDALRNLHKTVMDGKADIVDFGGYNFYVNMSNAEKLEYLEGNLPAETFANHVVVTRSLFRLEFLDRYKIRFDTKVAYSEDSIFSCTCRLKQPSICRIEKAYYLIRYWGGSATARGGDEITKKKFLSCHAATLKFQEFYSEAEGELKGKISDLLMSNLWHMLYIIARMSTGQAEALNTLHRDGLFPYFRPKECTLRKSYVTTRTDFVGKLFDELYIHMHRPWGFSLMWLLQRVISLKHKICK